MWKVFKKWCKTWISELHGLSISSGVNGWVNINNFLFGCLFLILLIIIFLISSFSINAINSILLDSFSSFGNLSSFVKFCKKFKKYFFPLDRKLCCLHLIYSSLVFESINSVLLSLNIAISLFNSSFSFGNIIKDLIYFFYH